MKRVRSWGPVGRLERRIAGKWAERQVDALNLLDWRIFHALAQRLIVRARALYAQKPSVLDLDASTYALDSNTIDPRLSLFDWAPLRSTKAGIKLHPLLNLRGAIPTLIHVSDGKLHDVNVLDKLPVETDAFFVRGAKKGMDARRVSSSPTQRDTGVIRDQRVMLNGFYSAKAYPEHLRIARFQGTSENPVKRKVWCAVATYVQIANVKRSVNSMRRSTHAYSSCRSR